MNSQSFHRVRSIKTDGVSHDNSNAIKLTIQCQAYQGELFDHGITLFDLPAHVAESIDRLLGEGGSLDEAAIRADERRKVWDELSKVALPDTPGFTV